MAKFKEINSEEPVIGYISSDQLIIGDILTHPTNRANCKVSITYDKIKGRGKMVIDLPKDLMYLAFRFEEVQ